MNTNLKVGVIGAGNMSTAIVSGLLKSGLVSKDRLAVSDKDEKKLASAKESFGINTASSNTDLVNDSNIVIIAVKPNVCQAALSGVSGVNNVQSKLFISIAAGVTISQLKEYVGFDAKVIRTMPNTPALVGEGMTVLSSAEPCTDADMDIAKEIFNAVGKTAVMPESLMCATVALNGSSPAYVYMMIEAMADAAVKSGIPRQTAYDLAAQSVLGSAKMVLETGEHPGKLKDMVCSPAGTTIAAVEVLEREGFRSAIMEAMSACTDKSYELAKK